MSQTLKNKIIILGYGYVGSALANEINNFEIVSTSRSNKTSEKIKIIDFDKNSLIDQLKEATHILSTIPPDLNIGDPILHDFKDIIITSPNLKYIAYLSATSVYGDHLGNWVNEESDLNLSSIRSKKRYNAEQQWKEIGQIKNIPVIIFRISGIYGPHRNVFENIKHGNIKNIYKKDHNFSRIHIDDIVMCLIKSIKFDKESNIYNLADDMPSPQYKVVEYAAKLLNLEPPKRISFEKAELSEMGKEFYSQNKKVSNSKIKLQLGIRLKYPSYKDGLKSLLTNI